MARCLTKEDILSVDFIQCKTSYDIEVADNSNYYLASKDQKILVHNSGKTFGIVQLLIGLAVKSKVHISVVSCSFPHLRRGALRDWKLIMKESGLYDENSHQKTEETYTYSNGSVIEFFSVDNPAKVRGPGRDILFINEANLLNRDSYIQLSMRTKKTIILDYNPADEYHWIYDEVLTREDCKFIQTTYLDNPFLPKAQKAEIERLREVGGHYWKVYGLGEKGQREGLIYPNHAMFDGDMPDAKTKGYGLDFGFSSDPTALILIHHDGSSTWEKEIIYETGLTNSDLINRMKALNVSKHIPIFADSAEPQRIEEIRRAGYQIKAVKKGPDSIRIGIDALSRYKRNIHSSSINLIKEIKSYAWMQDKEGKVTTNPIAFNDHAMDAVRYMIHMTTMKPKPVGRMKRREINKVPTKRVQTL
jgi:phage terminase large subunit